jgi:16S rRNA A1518/A1519 N6-dimethyltransferase RsmA/KsgA/DIM1 with predicted DNA glycosylase/AP lyase activity
LDEPAELGLARNATVLDLAAGTGKLIRLLVPRFRRVLAAEPDDDMRPVLDRLVPWTQLAA